MAVIAPNSEIYLIKCPIELDNENQLNFANATTQHNYFNALPKLSLTNATFQRKDGTIRWPGSMEDILEYNYCMYRNKNHGNKWFYAFIENMEYVSDSMTAIKIKTDVWQTWQFALNWKKCFVEREHVNDDGFGKNLVNEGLETGEYVCDKDELFRYNKPSGSTNPFGYYIVMQVTMMPNNQSLPAGCGKVIGNIPNGLYYLCFRYTASGQGEMNKVIQWYDENKNGDAIVALFLAPESIGPMTRRMTPLNSDGTNLVEIYYPQETDVPTLMGGDGKTFAMNTALDGYTPKNNKVYSHPFNYILVSNNNGDTFDYRFEDFRYGSDQSTIGDPHFNVIGTLSQGCEVKLYPTNYKKALQTDGEWDYGINGAKYPILSWTSDYYLNWKAQNQAHLYAKTGLNAITSIASAALTAPNIVGAGMAAANIAGGIMDAMHQETIASMVPDQAKGNAATGDLNFSNAMDVFSFKQMCVRYEFAKRIDDFFSAYGYRVNEYKIPNRTGRSNWNYVKTQGCNITGDMPQSDILEIKEMFNRGVTIWHNPSTFLDYSQNNNIV